MNTNPTAGSRESNCVMSRTSEEYERLRRQSELLESITGSVLESLEQIQSDRFDLVFARLLLQHLDDPVMTLRKMYGQVRPGAESLSRITISRRWTAILPSNLSLNSRKYSLACTRRRAEKLEWALSCLGSSSKQASVLPTAFVRSPLSSLVWRQ
jgi:Methyltransferase domain